MKKMTEAQVVQMLKEAAARRYGEAMPGNCCPRSAKRRRPSWEREIRSSPLRTSRPFSPGQPESDNVFATPLTRTFFIEETP